MWEQCKISVSDSSSVKTAQLPLTKMELFARKTALQLFFFPASPSQFLGANDPRFHVSLSKRLGVGKNKAKAKDTISVPC